MHSDATCHSPSFMKRDVAWRVFYFLLMCPLSPFAEWAKHWQTCFSDLFNCHLIQRTYHTFLHYVWAGTVRRKGDRDMPCIAGKQTSLKCYVHCIHYRQLFIDIMQHCSSIPCSCRSSISRSHAATVQIVSRISNDSSWFDRYADVSHVWNGIAGTLANPR